MLFKVAEKLATAPALQGFLEEVTDQIMTRVGATTGVVLLRARELDWSDVRSELARRARA